MSKPFILHIASWYPTKVNAFDGDFIQRHIDCIDGYYNVVIHAQEDLHGIYDHGHVEHFVSDNKEEHIVYYRPFWRILNPIYQYYYLNKIWNKINATKGLPTIIHVHVILYGMLLGRVLNKKHNIPLVVTEHSTLYTSKENIPFRKFRIMLSRWMAKRANKILTVSDQLRTEMIRLKYSSNMELVHNVVPDIFFETNIESLQKKEVKFIHVSSLHDEHKNIKGLLNTVKKLCKINPSFECTIAGNYFLQETSHMIQILEIPSKNIVLKGPLSHEEVALEMSKSDIFVLFSNFENYPCVLLEAQASGLRLIATDVGGVSEILDSNVDFLIEKKNEKELLQSMLYCIENKAHNPQVNRTKAYNKYNQKTIGQQMVNVYKSIGS